MVDRIDNIPSPEGWNNSFNMVFYAQEVLKNFLFSRQISNDHSKKDEIAKISKNLITIIWIGKSKILPPFEENKIIEDLKDLKDNLHTDTIFEKSRYLIQKLRNSSEKTYIIEHIVDIDDMVINNDENSLQLQNILDLVVNKIREKKDRFSLIQIDRTLLETKNNYSESKDINQLFFGLETILKL